MLFLTSPRLCLPASPGLWHRQLRAGACSLSRGCRALGHSRPRHLSCAHAGLQVKLAILSQPPMTNLTERLERTNESNFNVRKHVIVAVGKASKQRPPGEVLTPGVHE